MKCLLLLAHLIGCTCHKQRRPSAACGTLHARCHLVSREGALCRHVRAPVAYLRRLHLPKACPDKGLGNPALSINLLDCGLHRYPKHSCSHLRRSRTETSVLPEPTRTTCGRCMKLQPVLMVSTELLLPIWGLLFLQVGQRQLCGAGEGRAWRASCRHFLTSSAFTSGRAESWMATKAASWFDA